MLAEFVPFMCKEHNLEEEDVAATWMRFVKNEQSEVQVVGDDLPKKKPVKAKPKPISTADENPSEKMTLARLKEICRIKSIKVTGTKKQLLSRIQEHDASKSVEPEDPELKSEDPELKSERKVKKNEKPEDSEDSELKPKRKVKKNEKPAVLKAMEEKKPEIVIITDIYGNVVHEETGIAFSHDEEEIDGVKCRYAIGYRLDSGHLEELDAEKMKICDQYSFRYRVPENFDEE